MSQQIQAGTSVCEQQIGIEHRPRCYLCGSEGKLLYANLKDRLFGVPGTWNLKLCPDRACGLIWLDPMPREDELGRLYENHYPRPDNDELLAGTGRNAVYSVLRHFYRQSKHFYQEALLQKKRGGRCSWKAAIFSLPIRMVRFEREGIEIPARYLLRTTGRMLDVGCGNGEWVEIAETFGWEAEGVEPDRKAVEIARRKGRKVKLGTLAEQRYPDSLFDLITMCHVVEHVPDPVGLLRECRRILKPGGTLVVLTPNSASIGHFRYGSCWYPVLPPFHLMLFNGKNLSKVAESAGFKDFYITSTVRINEPHEVQSHRIRLDKAPAPPHPGPPLSLWEKLRAKVITLLTQPFLWFNPLAGDELVMEARG